jgi:hypothetical protein
MAERWNLCIKHLVEIIISGVIESQEREQGLVEQPPSTKQDLSANMVLNILVL